MKVFVATPTNHGTVTAGYAQTLVGISAECAAMGADMRLMMVEDAEIVSARNLLAQGFMSDGSLTHILFLDSDMKVEAHVIRRLLGLGVPIVGTSYPKRKLDLEIFASALLKTGDRGLAAAQASEFAIRLRQGPSEVEAGVTETDGFGFGCVLISKKVFEALASRGIAGERRRTNVAGQGMEETMIDYFSCVDDGAGDRLSEDFSFCERVKLLGNTRLLAYVGPGVGHTGQFTFDAVLLDLLRANRVITQNET